MKVKFKQPLALFVIFCLCLTMVLPVSAANTYNSELFTDIAGHWAEKEIARAIEAGYVSGMSATTFSPDLPMTRADFIKMINNAYGLKGMVKEENFSDVNEKDWFYDDVRKALFAKYIVGRDENTFAPYGSLTRAEAVVILSRLIPHYGFEDPSRASIFSDFTMASWAEEAIAIAYNKGYISGYPDNTFKPNGTLTRAEAIAIVLRVIDSENINNDDFQARVKTNYQNMIYTGTITVAEEDEVTFDNCIIVGTLESKTTKNKTNWKLINGTTVANFKYAEAGLMGGGGGGGSSNSRTALATPSINYDTPSLNSAVVISGTTADNDKVDNYKITVTRDGVTIFDQTVTPNDAKGYEITLAAEDVIAGSFTINVTANPANTAKYKSSKTATASFTIEQLSGFRLKAPQLAVAVSDADADQVILSIIDDPGNDAHQACELNYTVTMSKDGSIISGFPITVAAAPQSTATADLPIPRTAPGIYTISAVLNANTEVHDDPDCLNSLPATIEVTRMAAPVNVSIDAIAQADKNIIEVSWAAGDFSENAAAYEVMLQEMVNGYDASTPAQNITVNSTDLVSNEGRFALDVTDVVIGMALPADVSPADIRVFRAEVRALGNDTTILDSAWTKAGVAGSEIYHSTANVQIAAPATALTFDLSDVNKVEAEWTAPTEPPATGGYSFILYKDGIPVANYPVNVSAGTAYDVTTDIDPAIAAEFTFGVVTRGYVTTASSGDTLLVLDSPEALSNAAANTGEIGTIYSGPLTAPTLSIDDPAGADTTLWLSFLENDGVTPLSVYGLVDKYEVTVTIWKNGDPSALQPVTFEVPVTAADLSAGVVKVDLAQVMIGLNKLMPSDAMGYSDANYSITAVAHPQYPLVNTPSEASAPYSYDFSLESLDSELNPTISTSAEKTYVNWQSVLGADSYTVEITLPDGNKYTGTLSSTSPSEITAAFYNNEKLVPGKYTVTVKAYPISGSTVYKAGQASVETTVLEMSEVTLNSIGDTKTANWNPVEGAIGYAVTVKKDGIELNPPGTVTITDTSYDLTDIIKTNGAGEYTVEVIAVGDGSAYITSAAESASVSITQLAQPIASINSVTTDGANDVTVTWNQIAGTAPESYLVTVYRNDTALAATYSVPYDPIGTQYSVSIKESFTDEDRASAAAVSFKATVTAVGSLEVNTINSLESDKTDELLAGVLPDSELLTTEIVQDNGVLKVEYKLTNTTGGIDVDAIKSIKLAMDDGTNTYNFEDSNIPDLNTTSFFDVSNIAQDTKLPAGTYTATINVIPWNAVLNNATDSSGEITYAVETLPAPVLKVTNNGNYLHWAPIALNDATLDDPGDFSLQVKIGENWTAVSGTDVILVADGTITGIPAGNLYASTDAPDAFAGGTAREFKVIANNTKDMGYSSASEAEIIITKPNPVSNVSFDTTTYPDQVWAVWTNPIDSLSLNAIANYRVNLFKDGVKVDGYPLNTDDNTVSSLQLTGIDPENVNSYTLRVIAIGNHASAGKYDANSAQASSTETAISGTVPGLDAENAVIYESGGKLFLEVPFAQGTDFTKVKTEAIILNTFAKGTTSYSPALAGTFTPEAIDKAAYVTFDLSLVYETGFLAQGTWTATVTVTSKNTALNASSVNTVDADYTVTVLEAPVLQVNSETGEITWQAVDKADYYEVTVEYDSGSGWTTIGVAGEQTINATDPLAYYINDPTPGNVNGLVPGRVYKVTVIPYSNTPLEYPTDTTSEASVQVSKLSPVVFNAIDGTSGTVSWTNPNPAGVAGYNYTITNFNASGVTETGSIADPSVTSFTLSEIGLDINTDTLGHRVRMTVMAAPAGSVHYINSEQVISDSFVTGKIATPTNINYNPSSGELTFDYVNGAAGPRNNGYTVTITHPGSPTTITTLQNTDFYSKNAKPDKVTVYAASLDGLFESAGDWTVEIIANPANTTLRCPSDKATYIYTATGTPSVTAEIASIDADNGIITITLVAKPTTAPVAADFSATVAINGGSPTTLTLTNFSYDDDKTVTLIFTPITKELFEQSVVVAVTLGGVETEAPAFTVEALTLSVTAVIDSIDADNGSITITLVAKPTTAPVAADFSATVAIDGGSATDLTLTNFYYDGDTEVMFDFSPIAAKLSDQSVVVAVTLGGVETLAPAFTVYGDEAQYIEDVNSINDAEDMAEKLAELNNDLFDALTAVQQVEVATLFIATRNEGHVFNSISAIESALEGFIDNYNNILNNINNSTDASTILMILQTIEDSFDFGLLDYGAALYVLENKPAGGFTSFSEIKAVIALAP